MTFFVLFKVGIIENQIIAIGGKKRPSNTFETFDLEVSANY